MEGIFAVIGFFGMPVAITWLLLHYRALARGHTEQKQIGAGAEQRLTDEKKLLEARIANLESIVCSVDFELNQRLNRLAIEAGPPSLLVREAERAQLPQRAASARAIPAAGSHFAAGPTPLDVNAAGETLAIPKNLLFGRYRIERELGRGGMGAVFLARDDQLGEAVALKVISNQLGGDPAQAAERFRREASAARKVSHPSVIRIFEFGESESGELYLAMEYFPGLTLAEILRRRGALPLDEARAILGQVCDGLAAAHAAGVIHRDLKPGNILVGGGGAVKLIDFGLAKASWGAGMTATGLIMGTPEYMSPEQIRGREVDARADIYALGAVAYHVVSGSAPFSGDTPIAVGFAHCTQPVRTPTRADLPPAMAAAIVRALAKEPRDRFSTVEEFRRDLLRI